MYRNRELNHYILVQLLIVALFAVISMWKPPSTMLIIVMGAIFIVINMIFTCRRYKNIRNLNDYLVKIQNKNFTLDIRDNKEGELSILKNEIYKLTKMLSTQSELLQRDKTYLVDSISDISHQLKTPLTSMLMMVELIQLGNLPKDKEIEFTNNITVGLNRMQWLIQSLLKLSKLDADAVIFKSESIEMDSILKTSIQILLPMIEEKSIVVRLQNTKSPIDFKGDDAWFVEAFTNIIKNSLEYMEKEGELSISYSQNNLYTKIEIVDNGCGIEKEDIPYIFERFYKGRNSKPDSVGIGLALSKQIIQRQKGTLEVSSTVGVGTTFHIKLYN